MSIHFVDLKTQYEALKEEIQHRINGVLEHGQYIMGPEVAELELRLSAYTGAKHCITVSSGTDALLISLMALGIGPGDEVLTTPFTFAATAEVIVLLGASPVFVDIDPLTCNVDVEKLEAAITSKTKAIMPVSLYGQPSDMDEINSIARSHGNIPVIEDAAQSFGSEYKGRKSCNLSTIGCTSFFPSKPLGCYGDGGAIFTSDDMFAQACREIRIHGQSKRYWHTRIGLGGRMDTLQCAIVLAKLKRFDWEVTERIKIGARYNQIMDEMGVRRVHQRSDRTSVFAQYTIMLENREEVQNFLRSEGIPTAVHYPVPLNEQPVFRRFGSLKSTPYSSSVAKLVISLPMSADVTPVFETVQSALRKAINASSVFPLREQE
ncbi:DegT/DnrJ/EryC1/StrS family aminotransferase [Pseudomonas sp. NR3]|uniref:DegT/DnrJ/EryC1/StrS family aminotransferase n=1 Tax=Pseudomonas sp. NR3 TaxID=3155978 RepID=UPI003B685072